MANITICLDEKLIKSGWPYTLEFDDGYGHPLSTKEFMQLKAQINELPELPLCAYCGKYGYHTKTCTRDDPRYHTCKVCGADTWITS